MKKYILTKTIKGKKYLYEVKDENGNVISKRTSAREYVAATINGEFYFGRLDLVGKGNHGKELAYIQYCKTFNAETWKAARERKRRELNQCIAIERTLTHSAGWMENYIASCKNTLDCMFNPDEMENVIKERNAYAVKKEKEMKVAYLQK